MTTTYHTAIPSSPRQAANAATFNSPLADLDEAIGLQGGGASAPDNILKTWAIAMQMAAISSITRNAQGLVTDATVTWLDGATGTLEVTDGYDAGGTTQDDTDEDVWEAVNVYTITHSLSSQTVTVTVTRDSNNNATAVSAAVA